ncbi:hypothetical protein TIFTF001_007861, partial [Ficus carica]
YDYRAAEQRIHA